MNVQCFLLKIFPLIWLVANCAGLPKSQNVLTEKHANLLDPTSHSLSPMPDQVMDVHLTGQPSVNSKLALLSISAQDNKVNVAEPIINWPVAGEEGRMRRKKYKKQEVMMLTRMLMGLKVALLGVVLPLGVVVAKMLSWKAVTLSLLAFMLAKIVFVKNLFMSKTPLPSVAAPSPAPAAPIIIHSASPSHETIWKRHSQPRIHLQPEVHVHQGDEHQPTPSWTWAEEGRSASDPQRLAYDAYIPKSSSSYLTH